MKTVSAMNAPRALVLTLIFAGLAWFAAGCGTMGPAAKPDANAAAEPAARPPQTPPTSAEVVWPTNVVDRLQVGNRVTVVFSGIPNPPEPHTEQIRSDGFIQPPMLSLVKAAGRSIAELQQELHDQYVPALFKRITITVKNEERYFFVGGEVRAPGQKPYLSDMTLMKAIQAAGDFSEYADKRAILINRADGRQETVDAKAIIADPRRDVPIYPGDSIVVRRTVWGSFSG